MGPWELPAFLCQPDWLGRDQLQPPVQRQLLQPAACGLELYAEGSYCRQQGGVLRSLPYLPRYCRSMYSIYALGISW